MQTQRGEAVAGPVLSSHICKTHTSFQKPCLEGGPTGGVGGFKKVQTQAGETVSGLVTSSHTCKTHEEQGKLGRVG